MESEQATPVDSIKDNVQSSMKVPEFDKHLKKDVVEITIKMKTIVRKPLMIKVIVIIFARLVFLILTISIDPLRISLNDNHSQPKKSAT